MTLRFDQLDLIEPILKAVKEQGSETPTPIQEQAIPLLIQGRDVLGCAQTGTGKTAAFSLPVLQHLSRTQPRDLNTERSNESLPQSSNRRRGRASSRGGKRKIRALVLSPTRELIAQIGDNFASYSRYLSLRHLVIFGGVSATPQIEKLSHGVDILLATPNRLLDLENQGHIDLSDVEFFVLDEADRMLDMGFIHDIRRVLKLLPQKRPLLFSATMPPNIIELASSFLTDPAHVEVVPESTTAERVEQRVMFVEKKDKRRLLAHLLSQPEVEQSIVFTRTKLGEPLSTAPRESGTCLCSNPWEQIAKRKNERLTRLERSLPTLIATDIAARGLMFLA